MPRRFQFSLRTLLIGVTLFSILCAAYFGWQAKIVRERAVMLKWLEDRAPLTNIPRVTPGYNIGQDAKGRWEVSLSDSELTWLRRQLGDHWIEQIIHPTAAPDGDVDRIKALFPEAEVKSWFVADIVG